MNRGCPYFKVSIMRFRLLYDLPLLLYAVCIFVLSSFSYLSTPDLGFDAQDKLFHLFEYGILAFLTFRSFAVHLWTSRASRIISLSICLIYAATDELHQALVPGRFCDIWDFLADGTGIVVVYLFYWQFHKKTL